VGTDASNLLLILCCIVLVLTTHPLACSDGNTPLVCAIGEDRPEWTVNEDKADVVALLRSAAALPMLMP
jgi:hypothetical protein